MLNAQSTHPIGTWCELHQVPAVTALEKGMDFRLPIYRREVFLKFYEFHLHHRSHPGAVYFMLPWLQRSFNLTQEQMLWITFINGVCQHIVTTWRLFEQFPTFRADPQAMQTYIRDHWIELGWDMDRRYVKNKFCEALASYQTLIGSQSQVQYWQSLCASQDEKENFRRCWNTVMTQFQYFGRLSSFSYLEYQRIIGLPIECDSLFLDDMSGSKSHRNGIAVVCGRDDLDWHRSNPAFEGYRPQHLDWLIAQGDQLLQDAQTRFHDRDFRRDVTFFTLESTLCTYKSWHRKNRRYPNVYMDMFHGRITQAEVASRRDCTLFWNARKECLPDHLLLECNPSDPGLSPEKQNHYRNTGEVIMMEKMFPCFENSFMANGLRAFL
jgi:hypothetical protein